MRLLLIKTDLSAPALNADVFVASGYDSIVSLPAAFLGSGTTVGLSLQASSASGAWVSVSAVSVPAACAVGAATPVFNKVNGTITSGAFIWVQVSS